jgi:ArsR family transcriptional regulator
MVKTESLIRIYQCFCDETRLRILHLLQQGPLCVCHFQSILEEPQVKISKHLAYLRDKSLVEVMRHQNWMIYSLPRECSRELASNLQCLQDCAQENSIFRADLRKLRKMKKELCWVQEACGSGSTTCCDK